MHAAHDPRSRSRLQPRLQPMHSVRPPLRPCTVPAKTSFSPRHTRASMTAVNVSITRIPRLCLRAHSPPLIPQLPRRLPRFTCRDSAEPAESVFRCPSRRRRGLGEPLRHPVTIRIIEGDVLAFEITEIPQPVPESIPPGRVVNDADARDLRWLLRAGRERPCGRTAERR